MTNSDSGLLSAYVLDGTGGAQILDWDGVNENWDNESFVWVHLDYSKEDSRQWLTEKSGLDKVACEALVQEETRPRCVRHGDGLLLNIRGVNLNPGADPDDMVSLRMWIDHHRLISLRQRKLMAVEDVERDLKGGVGPKDAGGILVSLANYLIRRVGGVVYQLDEDMDSLEEELLGLTKVADLRMRISETRRIIIGIRRFLSPQREALGQLYMDHVDWMTERHKMHIRELIDKVTRHVEELDSIRDRAGVTHEELSIKLAEQTNRTMYLLSVIAGVFLPLGLLTGLLGINVGGMPGVESKWAFWIVCLILVVITIMEFMFLRRRKWI